VLPDLLTEFADIENDASLSAAQKLEKKAARQQHSATPRASASTTSPNSSRPTASTRRDVEYVVEENKVVIVDDLHRPQDGRPPLERWARTRPSKPRKAFKSTAKRKPSRPSPSKTISVSTISSPA
jgi:hypothetical protein